MRFFDSNKPKRKEKSKRPSRRWIVVGSLILVIVLIAGVAIIRPRFNPMSDVPTHDLFIVAAGTAGQNWETYRINFQTGERTVDSVVQRSNPYYPPSPDGHWWAHWEWVKEYTDSALMLDDLTHQEESRSLGTFYGADATLSWSPDNQWLTFTAYDPNIDMSAGAHAAEIWMLNIGTGELKRLTNNTYLDSDPYFSPDGTQIAYISAADGYARVYIMDVATGEARLLTPDQYGDKPRWSPDGQWIAFDAGYVATEGDRSWNDFNAYVIRVDGTHGHLLSTNSGIVREWATE